MRSPLHSRQRSLRPVLALLGVTGTALTLSLAPRAGAIGGGAASVSQPTSPRETAGATPSVSLFQTSASSYTGGGGSSSSSGGSGGSGNTPASEVTARGSASSGSTGGGSEERPPARRRSTPTAPSAERDEERGESAGRRRTARRREREEGPAGAQQRERVATSGGKSTVEAKDKAVLTPAPKDRILFTVGAGWESRYIYHGVDIISFNSKRRFVRNGFDANGDPAFVIKDIAPESSSIWYTNIGAEYKGFRFKLDYVQAVDSTVPFLQGRPGTSDIPGFTVDGNGNFTFPSKRRLYRELDPGLSYTVGLANLFDVTLGYTFFLFPNDDFKGTHFEGETIFQLTYKQLKYIKPSFIYYHYNSPFDDATVGDLNGSYVEFRLDAALPIIDRPNFGVTVAPYALGSYNIDFLKFGGSQDVGGWNTFETGVKVPVRLGRSFTVTPYGNYGLNVSSASEQANSLYGGGSKGVQFGEQTRFWGGVTVSYTF